MPRQDARAIPWWLWPHLLSLDAPLVAVGWQQWWAHLHGANLRWFHAAILGLSVWAVYLADRLADAGRAGPDDLDSARHRFAHRRRATLCGLLGAALAALALLAPWLLPAAEFGGGLMLLAAVGFYFQWIHGRLRGRGLPAPKEAVVGGLFAAGASFFVFCDAPGWPRSFPLDVLFFGAACVLNCALITKWECSRQDRREPASLLNAHPWLTAHLGECSLGLAFAAALAALLARSAGASAPLIVSALGLWALNHWRSRFSVTVLRVLADVVLLTPWVGLWRN